MQRLLSAKTSFVVLAAIASVLLALAGEYLGLHYNLWTSPGAYVWGLLHRDSDCGFLGCIGSSFGTMLAIDSICWFILLCMTALVIARTKRRKGADRSDPRVRK